MHEELCGPSLTKALERGELTVYLTSYICVNQIPC